MARRSNKSVAEILSPLIDVSLLCENTIYLALPDVKISLAIEDSTGYKFCEFMLNDRSRLSKGNILTASQSLAVNS
jgi:hypothetical protein